MSLASPMPQILICDDDSLFHLALKQSLKGRYECRSAYNVDEASVLLKKHAIDIVLLDIQMRTPDEGLKAIPSFLETDPEVAIIMISGLTDFATVREAMRLGALDYVPKDFNPDDLALTLAQTLERRDLRRRNAQQNFEAVSHQNQQLLIGKSQGIITLRKMIEKMRISSANVVITGETGTGKEVVARQLRRKNPDGSLAPFVAVDSSTIQSTMAESILFGHEKGSFTGAEKMAKGIFEEAAGGVVYFDEIANMPLSIQAKLLRVIQEREVTRLGSTKPISLEFRVICATNRDLESMVAAGEFKEDLLQRLNVLPLNIPPLRERKDDIPLLVEHFLSKQPGEGRLTFTEDAVAALEAYDWPGNIRELANVVAYVATMTEGVEVNVADLPPKIRDAETRRARGRAEKSSGEKKSFYEQVAEFEKSVLKREYGESDGNISRLAMTLGMDRSHLYSKLKEYGIHSPKK